MELKPSERIDPHDGFGGGTPRPRNDRPASAAMALGTSMARRMNSGATMFGSTWTSMIRDRPAPSARSARMYWFCLTVSTSARLVRA